jgi:hypothetical protein
MKIIESETPTYIELPRANVAGYKINQILEERIRAFIKARRVRRLTFFK